MRIMKIHFGHRVGKCMVIILQNEYVSILATSCFMCLIANQENTIAHQTPERFKRNKKAEFKLYSRHTEWPDYGMRGMFCYSSQGYSGRTYSL